MKIIQKITNLGLGNMALAALILTFGFITSNADAADAPKQFKAPENHPLSEIMSGYLFRDPTTQALQDDEFENPGMLWYQTGEDLWSKADGKNNKSCADCHADGSMKGVGNSFPKWNESLKKPVTLEQQVNQCRENYMGASAWKWEAKEMLSTIIYVKRQSVGMPMTVKTDGPMTPHFEKGKALYYRRTGQLNMSCANCHEENSGNYIRADHLSQGHINGFPTYRLKDQGIVSLHKRLEGCVRDTRAEFPKSGSPEFVDLEIYLAWRGQGLPIETPSVRH